MTLTAASAGAQETGCFEPVDPTPPSAGAPPTPVTLVPEMASGLAIRFDRSRDARTGVFFLTPGENQTLPEVGTVLEITRRPLERQEVFGQIRGGSYVASAVVTRRQEVTVTVCFDAATLDVGQGTYIGSVRIQDPRVEDVSIPLTMTFQYPHALWMAFGYSLFILVLGTAFVWATGQRTAGNPLTPTWFRDLRSWVWANLISMVPASIAAGGVFLARFWRDPAWGAKAPEDWFTLMGAMFTAYSAALAAASAAQGGGRRGGEGEPEPAERPRPSEAEAAERPRTPEGRRREAERHVLEVADPEPAIVAEDVEAPT